MIPNVEADLQVRLTLLTFWAANGASRAADGSLSSIANMRLDIAMAAYRSRIAFRHGRDWSSSHLAADLADLTTSALRFQLIECSSSISRRLGWRVEQA